MKVGGDITGESMSRPVHSGKAMLLTLKLASLAMAVCAGMYAYFHLLAREDWVFTKFASPPSPSLILGSSRGLQGLRPEVFNASDLGFAKSMYNFCFTVLPTKYGPAYFRQIVAKVQPGTRDGLFILDVAPLSLANDTGSALNDTGSFVENSTYMNLRNGVSGPFRFEYLIKYFIDPYYTLLWSKALSRRLPMAVSTEGWLDVRPPPMDSVSLDRRIRAKVRNQVQEHLSRQAFSERRASYLALIIAYLSERGKVIVVRLPVAPELLAAENEYFPAFDSLLAAMASHLPFRYINLTQSDLRNRTIDGNHLHRDAARAASKMLIDSLRAVPPRGHRKDNQSDFDFTKAAYISDTFDFRARASLTSSAYWLFSATISNPAASNIARISSALLKR